MIGFEALLRETQSYMCKACGNKLFDSGLKDAMRQLIKQYMKDHNYYVPHMNLAEAADRLYVEMAEYSFLTPLLARKDIEEINIKFLGRYSDNPIQGSAVQVFGAFFFRTARG